MLAIVVFVLGRLFVMDLVVDGKRFDVRTLRRVHPSNII